MTASLSPVTLAVQNLITAANDPSNTEVTPEYLEGLVRVKPDGTNRGSYVEGIDTLEATKQLLSDLEWEEMEHDRLPAGATFGTARYFHATLPKEMTGRTGILTYGSLTPEQRLRVALVKGSHGPEMVVPWTGPLAETREVWAIVGGDDAMLWTWYPGPLTPRLTPEIMEPLRMLLSGNEVAAQDREFINTLAVKLQS